MKTGAEKNRLEEMMLPCSNTIPKELGPATMEIRHQNHKLNVKTAINATTQRKNVGPKAAEQKERDQMEGRKRTRPRQQMRHWKKMLPTIPPHIPPEIK